MNLVAERADLHIHTCLSPCGDWDMTPSAIIRQCSRNNLSMIAVCDHNASENCEPAVTLGEKVGIRVFPGMEICSSEEVHLLSIFDTLEQVRAMQVYVYDHLTGENNPELFGYQVIANEHDEVEGENEHWLAGALSVGLYEIVKKVKSLNGLAILSHVDRPAFGVISQLGFVPPDLPVDGLEVSYRADPKKLDPLLIGQGKFSCITSSDAHYIHEIGVASTKFAIASRCVDEIRMALTNENGRHIV